MQTYKILEKDSVLLSQPLLIEHFGRAGAQFLNQLHYWLQQSQCGETHQGQKWIYNTESSWADQLKLSARQFRRYVSELTSSGVIFVKKLNPHKSNRTNYFSINYELLNAILDSNKDVCPANPSENRSFVHEDIMSSPSGQNVPIYIETKITNKDFNKSEALESERRGGEPKNQVEQVGNLNFVKKETGLDAQGCAQQMTKEEVLPKTKQKKPTTTRDMLEIWNAVLSSKAQGTMSKELAPLLMSAFAKKFDKKLSLWRTYCEAIKSSSYLMGEAFQLSIFWGLKFATIDRIRAGEFGVKRDHLGGGQGGQSARIEEEAIKKMIDELPESALAKQSRQKIATAIGYSAYHSWFHQAKFSDLDGKIRLEAPNAFVESIWERDYPWMMRF